MISVTRPSRAAVALSVCLALPATAHAQSPPPKTAGVVLADFYLLRRKQIDVAQLYADPKASMYGDVNWVGIGAFLAGRVCGWLFEFGLVGPLQGYISRHFLSDGDLSWLVGIVVAGGVYLLGMRGRVSAASARQLADATQPTA